MPIIHLVANHVDPGWAKTHFLSFTEDKLTALRFGLDCEYDQVANKSENYIEYYEDGHDWTFAIIAIDTQSINWIEIGTGIYYGSYKPGLTKFKTFPGNSKMILIDIAKAIQVHKQNSSFAKVLTNAIRDKEWLLLPASEMVMNTGIVEFSGIMDGSCISEIIKYKRIL